MLCVGVEASASSFPCRRTSVTACFFRPRALNAGRRHLSPARGPRSLPPSRLMHPRYRPVEFSAPPRLSRPLPLRLFPSATVRLPSTPFNFVRLSRRLPVAPVLLICRPLVDAAVVLPAPPRLRCTTRKS